MKKFVSLILCVSCLMSVCVNPAIAVGAEEDVSTFSLDKIDPQMSLLDALEQYPEIYDIFYIDKVAPEQAEMQQASEVKTINGDEVSASILYSLNARKVYSGDSISPYGSSPNGPWPYEQANGKSPNCYGYALGISQALDPGTYARCPLPSYPLPFSVDQIAEYVDKDMIETFRGAARRVSYQKVINSWEWRIATRVGYAKIVDNSGNVISTLRDYHFWLQTSAGTWCHKPGQTPSVHLGNVRPDTASWDLVDIKNFYDSDTIYLALYMMA